MHVLVTGVAGFIGSTLAHRLLERGDTVTGIDNVNDYYEVSLKHARLARLASHERWRTIIPIALVTYLFFYVIFDKLLNIPFPNGMIADALGMESFDSYIADPIWRLVTRR